ncbi:Hypothetical protein CAP_3287 [Chondromyces apiculatus DSM 436]|uniref:Uncharacterized protein n=1 Tax=Chondromyces apiculatus DSM 436 TaxID=1192034 RepID=A0A017T975_9BACT|nr:Hypothetical protein CAP_3287 [Chondromyces apiculatus DSM 436]
MVVQLPAASASASDLAEERAEGGEISLPPRLDVPTAAACVLEGPFQPRGEAALLRLHEGGPAFAELRGGVDVRVHLPAGRPAGVAVEVNAGGLSLRGHAHLAAIPVRPARPLAFHGFAVPLGSALLDLHEATQGGELTVTWPGAPGVMPVSGPVSERLRCDDVTVGELEIDAVRAAGALDGEREAFLRLGREIPLSVEPGGPVVAALRARNDEDAAVTVVGTRGARVRVLWWREEALVVGWVPGVELRWSAPFSSVIGDASGTGLLGLLGTAGGERRVCEVDVPLVAQVGEQRATVGVVRAGTRIEVLGRRAGYTRVAVAAGGVWIQEGAQILARTSDLARCVRAGG